MTSWVHVEFAKWGGRRHWTYDAIRVGEDEHGIWLGGPPGTVMDRPDLQLVLEYASAVLVPRDAWWVAAFNAPGPGTDAPCEVYIDISTPPVWSGDTMTAYDLDLDVVRRWDGAIEVLDEDEFAAHRVELGYPPEVVAQAVSSAANCRAVLEAGAEPFRTVFRDYLARATG